ncbi:ATP-binding cassette domain-containing protein [Vibrio owensii]|uniref:ATP-binding cassette domain-containing protein n=1 Tax=Vibrio owensii TaxID=696485 RepID=UPI00339646F3
MTLYRVNKKFASTVERSDRVLECAESFGLGLQEKNFIVYDDFQLEIKQGDIIYITGQSGSGKSLLLKELAVMMETGTKLKLANIDAVELEDKPLIDQIGKTTEEAIRILSLAGLNDAYLFIRKPKELSDGQLYRFRIAKLMGSDADVWVADEFGAVLDRTTAKVVGFSLQKFARLLNKTVLVATTHKDLREELAPDIYVDKRFRERVEVDIKRVQDEVKG